MSILLELSQLGQAIWLDYIQRSFMDTGKLQALIELGVRGVTSNPSIFEKAIAGSQDYDADIRRLSLAGRSVDEIYDLLSQEDICRAADLLRPVYDQTAGADGYVSLEVNPLLAHDTEATISEAMRLWQSVQRPNLMIKIPATPAGLPAIRRVIAEGINVNVTLIFSLERYREVMAAHQQGLQDRLTAGMPINSIASVASFFVSRIDTKIDKKLEEIQMSEGTDSDNASQLMGKAAVANARLAYQEFKAFTASAAWKKLEAQGARLQRPLWASTSTKNPAYPDTLYVATLIGEHTVNTLPQETLDAMLDHGQARLSIEDDLADAHLVFPRLHALGISMERVTQELEDEGVAAFAKSFRSLMASLQSKRDLILGSLAPFEFRPGDYQPAFQAGLQELETHHVLPRIWSRDYTVWKPEPMEIANRLGWLDIPDRMMAETQEIETFVRELQQEGYRQAVLLGMGGSSLAPEMFCKVFGVQPGYMDLLVMDSTDPLAVETIEKQLDLKHALFIVSTKSGTTEETLSFFKYFYNRMAAQVGQEQAGRHFIAITDPETRLVALAGQFHFRRTFLSDPNIGGRYSALSYFGLVPAACCGVNLTRLLDSARRMAEACGGSVPAEANPAARLGAALGALTAAGRDKLTLLSTPVLVSVGDWVEQLVAESTGKEGKGIVPIVGEPLPAREQYASDRIFISTSVGEDHTLSRFFEEIYSAGHPVIQIRLTDRDELGGLLFLWELATAVTSYFLRINPFDQPNVEAAKRAARAVTAAYQQAGNLPADDPDLSLGELRVYGGAAGNTASAALKGFLEQARDGDYVSLQAFIQPSEDNTAALQALREKILVSFGKATTLGYGPRFLHSTGQLHKGDSGKGLFIQFTCNHPRDLSIPLVANSDQSAISFGVLELSQALGDRQALLDAGRRVMRIHLARNIAENIFRLAADLA